MECCPSRQHVIHLLSTDRNPATGRSFPPAAFQSHGEMLGLRVGFQGMCPLPQLVLLYLSRAGPQSKRTQTRGNPLASASEVLLSPVIQAPWNIYRVKSFRFSVAHTKAPPAARSPTDHGPSASALSHGVSESSSGS